MAFVLAAPVTAIPRLPASGPESKRPSHVVSKAFDHTTMSPVTARLPASGPLSTPRTACPRLPASVLSSAVVSKGSTPPSRGWHVSCSGSDTVPASPHAEENVDIPVYVMLQLDTISLSGDLRARDELHIMLKTLKKEAKIDGVMVDVWWGIVERDAPGEYNWKGYKELFDLVSGLDLKLQVVMSFHRCGGNVGDNVNISLPTWISDIGDEDIYFTDSEGRRNQECLTWSVDQLPVLQHRTGLEVYANFMTAFRNQFKGILDCGRIVEIEVGLGPCGELRYPSYPEFFGWRYPNIGGFQCHDKYTLNALRSYVEEKGYSGFGWENPPGTKDSGSYNIPLKERDFFVKGKYDSLYGRFFLSFYSDLLLNHADNLLGLARAIFGSTPIAAKVAGVHWHYRSTCHEKDMCHPAELMAGFYNSANRDGYAQIASVLKKHGATLNFTCVEMLTKNQHPDAFSDPEALVWQVANACWDAGIDVACENALPCFGQDGYDKIKDIAKARGDDPARRKFSSMTYLRLCPELFEQSNFERFKAFVASMHK